MAIVSDAGDSRSAIQCLSGHALRGLCDIVPYAQAILEIPNGKESRRRRR